MMTASTYPVKSKDERIAHLRCARNLSIRLKLRSASTQVRSAGDRLAHILSDTIGRVLVMEEAEASQALDSIREIQAVRSLDLARQFHAEGEDKQAIVAIQWEIAFASSET